MANRRQARLNEQLKREISEVVRRDLDDPRVQGVTITAVRVTADLAYARVFVRVLGGPDGLGVALEGLAQASPFVRRELGRTLRLRRAPELHFEGDHTLEQARRIESLLDEVRPEGGWTDDDEGTDP